MKNKNFQLFLIQSIVFLSAFLLFQIELIIGKIFLPNFGGSYLVWGGCIVFFQAVLLLGYSYAYVILEKLTLTRYRIFHSVLILLPFLFFPGKMLALKFSLLGLPMMLEVFIKLFLTIGPVFFVLSTMSIIWQSWLRASDLPRKDNPYTLFAVSNLGSFAALLTYPFFIEARFDLYEQQHIWLVGYGLLVALNLWAMFSISVKSSFSKESVSVEKISRWKMLSWLLYSAGGVMAFLSVTNVLTSEIAPIPLLWVLPLAIYLLSFVLNFKRKPLCPKWMSEDFSWIGAVGILFYFFMTGDLTHKFSQGIFLLTYLFVLCMFCQNRVYANRPENKQLTFYYFVMSLGGFLGGMFVSWIVPLISGRHMEYFYAILCVCLAFVIEHAPKIKTFRVPIRHVFYLIFSVGFLFFIPMLPNDLKIWTMVILGGGFILFYWLLRKEFVFLFVAILIPIVLVSPIERKWSKRNIIYTKRNYYGIQKVFEQGGVRYLLHGTTIHGAQFLDPKMSFIPLIYYNPQSPTAKILIGENDLTDIAMIGLGSGALTMYLKAHQRVDLMELDPDMYTIAKKYFSYLDHSPGKIETFFGDARLTLEKENLRDRKYQLIIVDAFSGDSVPVHLLTTQALETYKKHLDPGGVIIFHVTNRYISISEPLLKAAEAKGAVVLFKSDLDYISKIFRSDWAALTWDAQTAKGLVLKYGWEPMQESKPKHLRPISDEYSTVLPYFKLGQLTNL